MNQAAEKVYLPSLPHASRHQVIFQEFDRLPQSGSLLLIHDEDMQSFYRQLVTIRGDRFDWRTLQNGPYIWTAILSRKAEPLSSPETSSATLNVTLLEPELRHATVFARFDTLEPGEAFRLLNDHDPRPLYYQLVAERGKVFGWRYLQAGPVRWEVEICKYETGETIGDIVTRDIRKADVFKRYGIDFCCGGKKTVRQACREKGLDPEAVEAELENAAFAPVAAPAFQQWQPDFLADYIYNQHHLYYYEEGPVVADLLAKVAARHGAQHPPLHRIEELFAALQEELKAHFIKEERVLFPYIKALAAAVRTGEGSGLWGYPEMAGPVGMMEAEHDGAGEILAQIREASGQFQPPAGACNSFRLLYHKLLSLEADLHQHIHLENNILFPGALRLEEEWKKKEAAR